MDITIHVDLWILVGISGFISGTTFLYMASTRALEKKIEKLFDRVRDKPWLIGDRVDLNKLIIEYRKKTLWEPWRTPRLSLYLMTTILNNLNNNPTPPNHSFPNS